MVEGHRCPICDSQLQKVVIESRERRLFFFTKIVLIETDTWTCVNKECPIRRGAPTDEVNRGMKLLEGLRNGR